MMEDLINRQTIIDGLEFVIKHGIETDGAHSISAEAMLEFVRELPTVQPEITHEQAIDYLHSTGWIQEHDRQMMLDGVHRLTAHPESHWIPVTERLPKVNGRYLVTRGLNACGAMWNRVYLLNYSDLMGLKSERIWWDGNVGKSDFERIDDVLAWMPLPEPYKEQRHE